MKNIVKNAISSIKNWWIYLVIGILFIATSVVVVVSPTESYTGLAGLFSFLILFTGMFSIYFSFANRKIMNGWGWYLAGGIFETFAGIALISYPEISLAVLPAFVGFWLLFRAAQLIANSIELKNYGILDWGYFMLLGVSLSFLAFFMIIDPLFGFMSILSLTSLSFLIAGISNIWLSLKLRKIKIQVKDVKNQIRHSVKAGLSELQEEIDSIIADSISEQNQESEPETNSKKASLSQQSIDSK